MKKIVDFVKKHKKLSILFLIFSFLLLFCIYDRSYIYPPIFFFDTNPVMIKLFKNKDNVNKADKYGITPLMKAVSMRNKKSVKLLLEKGADPNYIGEASNLVTENQLKYYWLMNSTKDKKNRTLKIGIPFRYKLINNSTKIIGENIWPIGFADKNPVEIACLGNEYSILQILLFANATPPGLNSIEHYQIDKTEKIINLLIEKGAKKNKNEVFDALIFLDLEVVEILLKKGINPNKIKGIYNGKKYYPLVPIIEVGDTERVKLLLQYRADIHLKDENSGESAFEYVQNNRNYIKKEIVEMIDRVEEENNKKNR